MSVCVLSCSYFTVFTPVLLCLCPNAPLCKAFVPVFFVLKGLFSMRPLLLFVLLVFMYSWILSCNYRVELNSRYEVTKNEVNGISIPGHLKTLHGGSIFY